MKIELRNDLEDVILTFTDIIVFYVHGDLINFLYKGELKSFDTSCYGYYILAD